MPKLYDLGIFKFGWIIKDKIKEFLFIFEDGG